ncbi:hypothetical protein PtA15_4A610 [Puccinia triticina]|uniref:Uncharacterized protein n=1 Tax=Puccinia triticina TaxID=208348 RepID=A0ABY7CG29_9BASI|nr:uncharacterized protein PtA15_4A610 [Puccinia triticina]WAQ84158.1 hypothetical protein PtA15_4A610 [Puccinia triticina]
MILELNDPQIVTRSLATIDDCSPLDPLLVSPPPSHRLSAVAHPVLFSSSCTLSLYSSDDTSLVSADHKRAWSRIVQENKTPDNRSRSG